jgi:endonuclease YncB( thermonuclease family)
MAAVPHTSATLLAAAAGVITIVLAAGAAEAERRDGPVAVAEVIAGDLARLADGRTLRLAGLRVPAARDGERGAERFAERARAELSGLLDGQVVTLIPADAPYDRYSRLVAHVERADGVWLQKALLERGLAQVQTRPGETARAGEMLAIEQAAAPRGAACGPSPRSWRRTRARLNTAPGAFASSAGGCSGSRRPSATCT